MTKESKQARDVFETKLAIVCKLNNKPATISDIKKLTRYLTMQENRLQRLANMSCDSKCHAKYWKNGVNPEQEKLEQLTLKYIKKYIGCEAYTQRDPRGMIIRLYLNVPATNYFHNNFDGETSGVNWIDY